MSFFQTNSDAEAVGNARSGASLDEREMGFGAFMPHNGPISEIHPQ
jgi:hypothetical protein